MIKVYLMSSPENMRTGFSIGATRENYFPETFFIIYLVLASILRRCGFKDSVLYANHSKIIYNNDFFDSGILFNLFSKYGVGKSLEPLIHELFATIGLDPEKHQDNVFFQEIVRVTMEVSKVVRSHDPMIETEWMYNYAMKMESMDDGIAKERLERLKDLLKPSVVQEDQVPPMPFIPSIPLETGDNIKYDTEIYRTIDDIYSMEISTDDILSLDESQKGIFGSYNSSDDPDYSYSDYSDETETEMNFSFTDTNYECSCSFCEEFRKYHNVEENRNVTDILNETLMNIASRINREYILG